MKRKTFLRIFGLTTLGFGMSNLNRLRQLADELPRTERMPVLFTGHGNPMNAIEENQFVRGFREAAAALPEPQAVLVISAHWFTRGTKVTAMEMPRTIHDFGGFPQELFEVQYPAPGNPALAETTRQLLDPTLVELDEKWGLDHGAWTVLRHFFPEANIPVIQLSIDYTQPASYHYELAQRLRTLRERGVLIVGSGNIIHNLRLVDWSNFDRVDYGYDWAQEAHATINEWLLDGNYQPLLDYERQGRAFQLAVPTPDHYLPLIYTLGLQEQGEALSLFNDHLLAGSLSMTSVRIG